MPTRFRLILVCLFGLAWPLLAQDQGKDKAAEKKDAVKEAAKEKPKAATHVKKYNLAGKVTGKITGVDTKQMTVEVEVKVRAGRGYRDEKKTFNIAEDAKIRIMNLPERFDEKDRPVPYTAAEKYKLKGDNPKLPGYTAELSALKKSQTVEVELSLNKPAPGAARKKNAEPEEPFVTMIVIHADEPKAMEKKK